MQAQVWSPRLANLFTRSCKTTNSLRAFSSSAFSNHSRGGHPRFYSEQLPPSKDGVVRVKGDEFWHMTRVLRLTIDDRAELFDGKGGLVEGCIQNIDQTGPSRIQSRYLLITHAICGSSAYHPDFSLHASGE